MPSNPYMSMPTKKRPPPAGPQGVVGMTGTPTKLDKNGRQIRELHDFTWHCAYCCTERKHRTGYLFTVYCGPDTLRFCNVNCYDKWLEDNPEIKTRQEPATDRRGAIAATKAKNELQKT